MSHEISDDIEQRMVIKPVEAFPPSIVGRLSKEEMDEFTDKDLRSVMLAISKLQQFQQMQWTRFETFVWQCRQSEANRIRSEDRRDRNLKWILRSIILSILGAAAMKIFKVL